MRQFNRGRIHTASDKNREIRGLMTLKNKGEQVPFLIWDISSKGLGLWSHLPVNESQLVTLTFSQPYLIVIKAKVAWCENQGKKHGYRIGLNVEVEDRQKLAGISSKISNGA